MEMYEVMTDELIDRILSETRVEGVSFVEFEEFEQQVEIFK